MEFMSKGGSDEARTLTPKSYVIGAKVRQKLSGAEKTGSRSLVVNSSLIVRPLGIAALLIIATHVVLQSLAHFAGHQRVYGLVALFNVDAEMNIPSIFSTLLILVAFLLLVLITRLQRQTGSPVWHWGLLSAGFLYLAADEAWSFHEWWGGPVNRLVGDLGGIFYFSWVIAGLVAIVAVGLLFSGFLRGLPRKTMFAFLRAGALYVSGVIGVEMIGAVFTEANGKNNFTYSMIVAIEEGLEMAGMIMFIRALLGFLASNFKEVLFR